VDVAQSAEVQRLLDTSRLRFAPALDPAFVRAEWEAVVQSQGLATWAEYRGARRAGRGRPLSVVERKTLWQVFEAVLDGLRGQRRYDWPSLCRFATDQLASGKAKSPFDAVLVDEVQDLKPAELRFLRAMAGDHPGELILFGDAGQRI